VRTGKPSQYISNQHQGQLSLPSVHGR